MPTGKRTRSIRLKDLKTTYLEELRARCFKQLDKELHERTVFPRELEDEIWNYYRKTSPSLQEFYSRYTPEWETFYENETLPQADFLCFLRQMQAAFRKRYSLMELNLPYYIERMEGLPAQSEERKELQEMFLDKWHRLLTDKKYDYQYHHIESLCKEFILLDKHFGLKTEASQTGSRIKWLLLNHPQLYKKIVPYEKSMKENRAIRELVKLLGKYSRGEKRSFEPLSGIKKEKLITHASHSDIEGITLGNDLNHLLPIEYCQLADKDLRPVFMQRFAEKQLQMFDGMPQEDNASESRAYKPVSGQGPFIICIDTSGSMEGKREHLAKSAMLAIAGLTEKTHRKCYVINFSEDIRCLLIRNLKTDLPLLAEFLNYRFDGGTDILPALREALGMIKNNGWQRSDIVLISDFEMPPATDELTESIRRARLRETRFYGLVFGSRPETDYLALCDKYWNMDIP